MAFSIMAMCITTLRVMAQTIILILSTKAVILKTLSVIPPRIMTLRRSTLSRTSLKRVAEWHYTKT
jgi:hypothetical protein